MACMVSWTSHGTPGWNSIIRVARDKKENKNRPETKLHNQHHSPFAHQFHLLCSDNRKDFLSDQYGSMFLIAEDCQLGEHEE
jgi:hypothetical protein